MGKKKTAGAEIAKQIPIKQIYDDLAHPALSTVGQALQGTIKLALFPISIMVWGYDRISEYLNIAIPEYFSRKKVSKDRIVSPEPYIAVPILTAISYCMDRDELKEMYTILLASSMLIDKKEEVHPSFAELIKQMSPNDAILLEKIAEYGSTIPIIDIEYYHGPNQFEVEVQKFSPIAAEIGGSFDDIAACFDNLERLKIIEIPPGIEDSNRELYKNCENHPRIREVMEKPVPEDCRREIKNRVVGITAYGRKFIDVCVDLN